MTLNALECCFLADGKTHNIVGSKSSSDCSLCDEGKYSMGGEGCSDCPDGYISTVDRIHCEPSETPSSSPSWTPSPTMLGTISSTASVTQSSSPSQTASATPPLSVSPSAASTGTPSRTPTTGSPTSSMTLSRTSTVSATESTTATPSITGTRTSSYTPSPSESKTKTSTSSGSQTPSLNPSATLSHVDLGHKDGTHGSKQSSASLIEQTGALVGFTLATSLVLLLLFYITFKRHENKKRHDNKTTSLSEQYAIQFGIKTPKIEDENHRRASTSISSINTAGAKCGFDSTKNPLASMTLARANFTEGPTVIGEDEHTVGYNVCSIQASATKTPSFPFELIELKSMDSSERSTVKILSSRRPQIKNIELHESEESNSRMQIAVVSDLDTSSLSTLNRTIIKLRQWKARVLNEPPPVVEVNITDTACASMRKGEREVEKKQRQITQNLVGSLRFAKGKEDNLFTIQNEVARHVNHRRHGLARVTSRKKEFVAIPRGPSIDSRVSQAQKDISWLLLGSTGGAFHLLVFALLEDTLLAVGILAAPVNMHQLFETMKWARLHVPCTCHHLKLLHTICIG